MSMCPHRVVCCSSPLQLCWNSWKRAKRKQAFESHTPGFEMGMKEFPNIAVSWEGDIPQVFEAKYIVKRDGLSTDFTSGRDACCSFNLSTFTFSSTSLRLRNLEACALCGTYFCGCWLILYSRQHKVGRRFRIGGAMSIHICRIWFRILWSFLGLHCRWGSVSCGSNRSLPTWLGIYDREVIIGPLQPKIHVVHFKMVVVLGPHLVDF